jgi:nitrite reductase (NADH) small subunit
MSGTLHRIGALADLHEDLPITAEIGGTTVAVFKLGDDIVATNGTCPHAQGPLYQGDIEGCVIVCPWHGWSFDLKTGKCEEDDGLQLQTYEVVVEGDDILVKL